MVLYSTNLYAITDTKMWEQLLTIKGHPDNPEYVLSILLKIMFKVKKQYLESLGEKVLSLPEPWTMAHGIGTYNFNSLGGVNAVISVFYMRTSRLRGIQKVPRFTHLISGLVRLRPKAMSLHVVF